jgi:hypothetical protein
LIRVHPRHPRQVLTLVLLITSPDHPITRSPDLFLLQLLSVAQTVFRVFKLRQAEQRFYASGKDHTSGNQRP